ncbi:hypothetical protein GVAV_003367 [Gurleya vavrai]
MQLKDSIKHLTNNSGLLSEELTNLDNIENQYVVIHNRILYFYKANKYFTLAQGDVDIAVKVVESSFGNKSIEFLESRTEIDAFSLGPDNKERIKVNKSQSLDIEKQKSGALMHRQKKNGNKMQRFNNKNHSVQRKPNNQHKENEQYNYDANKNNVDKNEVEILEDDENKVSDEYVDLKKPMLTIKKEINREPHMHELKDNSIVSMKYNKHFLDDEILPTDLVKEKQNNRHLIESDSSMDDYVDGFMFKDVVVKEVDSNFFQLVANKNLCVTSFYDKFIFTACNKKNEKQLYTMIKADEILRNLRSIKKEEIIKPEKRLDDNVNKNKIEDSSNNDDLKKNNDDNIKNNNNNDNMKNNIKNNDDNLKNKLFKPDANTKNESLIQENITITSIKTTTVPTTVTVTQKPVVVTEKEKSIQEENKKNSKEKEEIEKADQKIEKSVNFNDSHKGEDTIETSKLKNNNDELKLNNFLTDNAVTHDDEDFISRMQNMFSLSDIGFNNID